MRDYAAIIADAQLYGCMLQSVARFRPVVFSTIRSAVAPTNTRVALFPHRSGRFEPRGLPRCKLGAVIRDQTVVFVVVIKR
jgi:hypothetical protein